MSIWISEIMRFFKGRFGQDGASPSERNHALKDLEMPSHEWRRALKFMIALISCVLLCAVGVVLPTLIWVQLGAVSAVSLIDGLVRGAICLSVGYFCGSAIARILLCTWIKPFKTM